MTNMFMVHVQIIFCKNCFPKFPTRPRGNFRPLFGNCFIGKNLTSSIQVAARAPLGFISQRSHRSITATSTHITCTDNSFIISFIIVQRQRRYTWHQSIYVIFFLILYIQILLISNLPGDKLANLGNLIYEHFKKNSW